MKNPSIAFVCTLFVLLAVAFVALLLSGPSDAQVLQAVADDTQDAISAAKTAHKVSTAGLALFAGRAE